MFRKPKPLTGLLTREQFAAHWNALVPAREMARRCDLSLPLIYRAAKELSLPLRGRFPPATSATYIGPWTAQRDETLRQLWAEGLPTAAIAARMGISKNAAVGRAHRLHLPSRGSPIVRGRKADAAFIAARVHLPVVDLTKQGRGAIAAALVGVDVAAQLAPRPKPTDVTADHASPASAPSTRSIPLPPPKARADLYSSAMTCQWICNERPENPRPDWPEFCGEKRQRGSAYCGPHHRRCCSARVALASMPLDAPGAA